MKLLLDTVESLRIAWNALIANKARGVLTTLGIIIGIVAVTTTMTAFNCSNAGRIHGGNGVSGRMASVSRASAAKLTRTSTMMAPEKKLTPPGSSGSSQSWT